MGACRTKVAGQFREGSGLTMFTSDVSARGVDYPDVSLVLQVPTCWLNRLLLLWDAQSTCCMHWHSFFSETLSCDGAMMSDCMATNALTALIQFQCVPG